MQRHTGCVGQLHRSKQLDETLWTISLNIIRLRVNDIGARPPASPPDPAVKPRIEGVESCKTGCTLQTTRGRTASDNETGCSSMNVQDRATGS